MTDDALIDLIQDAYPRLWSACHVAHRTRGRPGASGLTDRETGLLMHIPAEGTTPAELCAHLGIAKSTLSAHLARLADLGLVRVEDDATDQRRRHVHLTADGQRTRRAEAVLDHERLAALLAEIPADERVAAVQGLVRLGQAAQRLTQSRRDTP